MASSGNRPCPWLATNGLKVEARTSRTITLGWDSQSDVRGVKPIFGIPRATGIGVSSLPPPTPFNSPREPKVPDLYELQMKKGGSDSWVTIYIGYSSKYEMLDLKPDSNLSFRMRKNGEPEWGSTIMASTDSPPPNASDLHGAVQCNHEDLVMRIIANCTSTYLKKLLISHDRAGNTPLMSAASNSNSDIMAILLRVGANVNAQAINTEKTALMICCFKGNLDCVQLLDEAGAAWDLRDSNGCTAVHHAVSGESSRVVAFAIQRRGLDAIDETEKSGWTPLLRAVIIGNSRETLKLLLENGANPNARDNKNSKSCLLAAAMLGKPKFVSILLEYKADPSYKNGNSQTALSIAFSLGFKDIVKMLEDALDVKSPTPAAPGHSSKKTPTKKPVPGSKLGSKLVKEIAVPTPELSNAEYLEELHNKIHLLALQASRTEEEFDLEEHKARIQRIKRKNLILK